jgi:hypothetical protein
VKGIEPSVENSEVAQNQSIANPADSGNTQIRAQMAGAMGRDLSLVVAAWAHLSAPLKAAILAIVISASAVQEDES